MVIRLYCITLYSKYLVSIIPILPETVINIIKNKYVL